MTAQALWLERLEEAANFTRWVGDEIRPFIRGRVLEVGCGSGTYTQLFAQWADAVVAVDIDPSFAAATARRFANSPKVEVQQADAQRLPNMGSFDTIVMLDVLEHIEDDVGTLAALRGMLNEKGSIVLKIPALPQLYGALDAQTRAMMQENLLRLWAEFKITVLFVTHDVDEAIFLADRVLIMSAAPGRIIEDMPVSLPRPRSPDVSTDPAFVALKRHCLQAIRTESLKAFEDQDH
jgi:2-polyprenyl-3-methyl-5-hydroxy-6-metoxy-1,4-benzoquinol methylase